MCGMRIRAICVFVPFVLLAATGCLDVVIDVDTGAGGSSEGSSSGAGVGSSSSSEGSDGGSTGPGGSSDESSSSSEDSTGGEDSGGSSEDSNTASGGEDSGGEPTCEIVWAEQWGADATCECIDKPTTHATAGECGPCVWADATDTCTCPLGVAPPEWCLPIPGGCTTVPAWSGTDCVCEGDDGSIVVLPIRTQAACES